MDIDQYACKLLKHMNQVEEIDSPRLYVDLDIVKQKFEALQQLMPETHCFYSVKANSNPRILQTLNELSAYFEVASLREIQLCLEQGISRDRIHFGNTIKKISDIKSAVALGIQSFSFDSHTELKKLVEHAPGCKVQVRLAVIGVGAIWTLAKKFGVPTHQASELLIEAHKNGMVVDGVCFHVGSQQHQALTWNAAMLRVKELTEDLQPHGIFLKTINLGGGLPSSNITNPKTKEVAKPLEYYTETILTSKSKLLAEDTLLTIEPGRYVVADSGAIVTEVIGKAERYQHDRVETWIYTDIGKYNGFYEAGDVEYPIRIIRQGHLLNTKQTTPCVIAGPSCDSADILFGPNGMIDLPQDINVGDYLVFFGTGAYSTSYASVAFNGFAPIKESFLS